jgi:hypothetical protein
MMAAIMLAQQTTSAVYNSKDVFQLLALLARSSSTKVAIVAMKWRIKAEIPSRITPWTAKTTTSQRAHMERWMVIAKRILAVTLLQLAQVRAKLVLIAVDGLIHPINVP